MEAKRFLMIAAILLAGSAFAQQVDSPGAKRIQRTEAIAMGNLTEVTTPRVPDDVKNRVAGKVVLQIVIDRGGKVSQAKPLSGDPVLAGASLDAVRQWRFRPYFLDSVPVEVETTATVEFLTEPPYVNTPKPYSGPLRIRVSSGVLAGLILHKVEPHYPAEARANHIHGDVVLRATIGRDGSVADLKLVSGDAALTEAAIKP
jgi:TonB family protein